jgi:hypothetical protein
LDTENDTERQSSRSYSISTSHDSQFEEEEQSSSDAAVPRSHSPHSAASESRVRTNRQAVYYEEGPFIEDDNDDNDLIPSLGMDQKDISGGGLNVNTEPSSPHSQASSIALPEAYGLPPGWQAAYGNIRVFLVMSIRRFVLHVMF